MSNGYQKDPFPNQGYGQNQGYGGTEPKPEYKNTCRDEDEKGRKKRPTRVAISKELSKICRLLFEAKGTVAQFEEKYLKTTDLLNDKKHLFKKTEANYQRYRNFDMLTGSELLQFNDSVKANVATYNTVYKGLNDALRNVAKGIKELKAKVTDLKEEGSKLDNCVRDDCNKTQRRALTGKAPGCPDDPDPKCPQAATILDELIYRPLGLLQDVDYLFKSSYEVVGIQTFSNVESFNALQKKLEDQSKKMGSHVSEISKAREADLKKLQEEIIKIIKDNEKNWLDLNHQRSNFEGYRDAADFLCAQPCECSPPKEPNINEGRPQLAWARLQGCAEDICNICKIVDNAFCCPPETPPVPKPDPNC